MSAIWRLDFSKPSSKLRLTMYMGIDPFKLFVCSLLVGSNLSYDELSRIFLVCCQVKFECLMLPRGSGNHEFVISVKTTQGDLSIFIGVGSEGLRQPFALDESFEPFENRFGTIFFIDQAAFFDPALPVREAPIIDRDDQRMTEALPVHLLHEVGLRLRRPHPRAETALDLLL